MSDLRTELNQLKDQRLDYVMARSKVNSDAQGIRDAGISRATFYTWAQIERDRLNEIAQQLKRETALKAIMILQTATEDAARVKVDGLKSRNEHIKQDVATEILDRGIGKASDKLDVTSGGEKITVTLKSD